jgi:hypothetical protein
MDLARALLFSASRLSAGAVAPRTAGARRTDAGCHVRARGVQQAWPSND